MNPRIRPAVWAFVGVLTALLVLGQFATLSGLYAESRADVRRDRATAALTRSTAETARRIADCTEPTGVCYRRGQERTASVVGTLTASTQRIVAAALSCQADGVTEQKKLIRCIVERTPR